MSDLIGQVNPVQMDVELRYMAVMAFLYAGVSSQVFHILMPEVQFICSPAAHKMPQNLDSMIFGDPPNMNKQWLPEIGDNPQSSI